jgi:predicted nucleic acid-binding protein
MQTTIISDTSCLILLDKINELQLLQKLFKIITVTQIVADEFAYPLPEWIKIQNPTNKKEVLLLGASVDKGEASAIALALEHKDCLLIIDEVKGRKLALSLGLIITGTLGIIAEAKKAGHIPSVKTILDKIKLTNFRISEELEKEILNQSKE